MRYLLSCNVYARDPDFFTKNLRKFLSFFYFHGTIPCAPLTPCLRQASGARHPISKPLSPGHSFLKKTATLKRGQPGKGFKLPPLNRPLKGAALASCRISHTSGLSALSGSSRLRSVRHSEAHSSRSAPPPPRFRFQARLPGSFVFFPPLFDYISRANEYKAKPFGRA